MGFHGGGEGGLQKSPASDQLIAVTATAGGFQPAKLSSPEGKGQPPVEALDQRCKLDQVCSPFLVFS